MLELPNEAEIECQNCSSSFFVSGKDMYVQTVGNHERGMGPETAYAASLDVVCPNCDTEISINYEAFEYPIGALNHSETSVYGGTLIKSFGDIDFPFEEEIYSYHEDSSLYLPEEKQIIANLQLSAFELISKVSGHPEILFQIAPTEFEELIAYIFSKHGFEVQLTQKTRDGGRDIIAIKSELDIRSKFIIECKRYAKNRPIGVELVRALYGVQVQEGANKSILATTSYFSTDALKFANAVHTTQWAMDLKGYSDIINWVRKVNQQ